MNKPHESPILTRVLFTYGFLTIIFALIGGVAVCFTESVNIGVGICIGASFTGIIYIGIGQAVDYLARTAHSTDRLCVILETTITERLQAIENSSYTRLAPTTSSTSKAGYFYSTDGSQQGPVDATDLRMMRKDGLVNDDTPVLREGETAWRKFRDYLALSR